MADEPNRVEIGEVRTDVVITEGVGPLSRADVQAPGFDGAGTGPPRTRNELAKRKGHRD